MATASWEGHHRVAMGVGPTAQVIDLTDIVDILAGGGVRTDDRSACRIL